MTFLLTRAKLSNNYYKGNILLLRVIKENDLTEFEMMKFSQLEICTNCNALKEKLKIENGNQKP
jgi:hypothetical protein